VRILVVEEELKIANLVKRGLEREGYAVDVAGDGHEALWAARELDYDAIVLDAIIPGPDGFEVCRTLRRERRWAPVLLLTARDAVSDRVAGLDAGADDYLTKPFAFAELFARLRALTRRDPVERPVVLEGGDLRLDSVTRTVHRGDHVHRAVGQGVLAPRVLLRHPGEVLSRSRILDHVWDFSYDGTSNVVDVYARYLREKVDRPFGRADLRRCGAPATGSGRRRREDCSIVLILVSWSGREDAAVTEAVADAAAPVSAPRAATRPRTAAAPELSPADRIAHRVLRIPQASADVSAASAYTSFQRSMVLSAARCTLTYVVFPFVLPAAGLAAGVGPLLGIVIGVLAMCCDVLTIRRFFAAHHRWRWPVSILASCVISLLLVLLVEDVAQLIA
jgi:two-component system OmpR family response regulator